MKMQISRILYYIIVFVTYVNIKYQIIYFFPGRNSAQRGIFRIWKVIRKFVTFQILEIPVFYFVWITVKFGDDFKLSYWISVKFADVERVEASP